MHIHYLFVISSFAIFTHIDQLYLPPKKSAIGNTSSLLSRGIQQSYHHIHPPNGQAEHRDASQTNQGSMGGA